MIGCGYTDDEIRNLREALSKCQAELERLTRNRDNDTEMEQDNLKEELDSARERSSIVIPVTENKIS